VGRLAAIALLVLLLFPLVVGVPVALALDPTTEQPTEETGQSGGCASGDIACHIVEGIKRLWDMVVGGFLFLFEGLKSFGEFLWRGVQAVGAALGYVVEGFRLLGAGFAAIGDLFGSPGDPGRYYHVATAAIYDEVAKKAVANCSRVTLGELAHIVPEWKNSSETFCKVAPRGILGAISSAVHGVLWFGNESRRRGFENPVAFIGRYLVILWLGSAIFVVVLGMERASRKHSFEPLYDALMLAGRILVFPFKVIWKLIEWVIKFIQALADFLDAIIPF